MVDTLSQFERAPRETYVYSTVVSIQAFGIFTVKTTTGLQITINDSSYGDNIRVGDQLILSRDSNNLASTFIIRKIDKIYPSSTSFTIGLNEG